MNLYQQFIAKSRYARYLDKEKRREHWPETVARYFDFMTEHLKERCDYDLSTELRSELEQAVLNLEVMPSMRALMTAGPALKRTNMAGFNCLGGSTLVTTKEKGSVPISEVVGPVTLLCSDGDWHSAVVNSFGRQETVILKLSMNSRSLEIPVTLDHRWYLQDGRILKTRELKRGDKIPFVKPPKQITDEDDYAKGILHGVVFGDGCGIHSVNRSLGYQLRLCSDSRDLLPLLESQASSINYPPSMGGDPVLFFRDGFAKTTPLKELPYEHESDSYLIGFIRGWFAADGSVLGNGQIRITSQRTHLEWLQGVGPRVGFYSQSSIQSCSEETNFGKRKQDTCNLLLDKLCFTKEDFLMPTKAARFKPQIRCEYCVKELDISRPFVEEVFCATVPGVNNFVISQGLLTGNCSFLSIDDLKAFDELLFCLMCGTGVGFSVERQNTNKLPEVPEALFDSETTVVVSDSKEGWAKGLRQLVALLYSGEIPKWDLHKVREAGSRLKTFGGRASGPRPLDDLFRFVVGIFRQAVGRKLTSLECHDLCCKIAEVVVVGGSRRSALISLSNLSDERMRKAKSGEWWNSSPERSLANNSAVYTEKPEVGVFMKEWLSLYESKSGERGIFNRKAAEKQAERTGRRKAYKGFGTNPCQPGWATVLTPEGIRRLDDVGEGSVIWSGQQWTRITAKWSTGVKPVFDYVTGWGRFTGTSNHRVVQFGEKVEVKDAVCIDPSPDPRFLIAELPIRNPITDVVYLGDHEVFDLTVEAEEHTYWTGGLLVSNCGEVVLRSQGLCNLTEVVCRPEDTELDLIRKARLAAILGTFQSTLTYFPYVRKGWVVNAEEERLLGVSLTGICDCGLLNDPDDKDLPGRLSWLKDHIVHVNQEMADKLGINPSVATTVVKPSGCQRMDTLIPTSEGLLTLAELGQSDNYDFVPFPETMTVSQGLGSSEATHFKGNGFVKTLKINLSSGLSLEATPNHQYKVLRQGQVVWANASDIAAGDKFPYRLGGYNRDCERPLSADHHVACNAEVLKYPKHMCPTLAWFLGVYTGDGSNHRKGVRIACDSSKPEHIAKVKAVVLELFGKRATVSMPSNPKSKGLSVDISSTSLLSWLRHNGLAKNKTAEVEIPLIIRSSSSKSLNAFMDGYNAADGCYSHIGMTWCTVSEKMAVQAVVALRSLGRDAVIYKMPPTKTSWGKKMRYFIQERKGLLGNRSNAPLDYRVSLSDLKKEGYESHLWDVVTSIEKSMCHTGDLSVPVGNEYLSNSYISHNTVSQLVQSSSGIHPAHARYYIRRVRNDNKDPITQLLKDAGVPNEPCVLRGDTTTVFSFPMKTPPETLLRKDLSALDHFKLWLIYKQNYTEHNPSITISVRESEWPQVGAEVWKNFDEVLGVSFLPYNDKDHIYKQAPYEEISEQKYEEMASLMPKSIDWDSLVEEDDNVEGVQTLACTGGFCEI